MAHQGHLYRMGIRGRSITSAPGVGGTTFIAHLACSSCAVIGERRLRQLMPPEQVDHKFIQAGWSLDPHLCPTCKALPAKEKTMTAKPSAAAMKAQAQMFHLLSAHFDPEQGAFAVGWADQRVAAETGLAADVVTEFRRAGFGELKEPPEVRALRDDIQSLASLQAEQQASVTQEIASLRARVSELSKRWAA